MGDPSAQDAADSGAGRPAGRDYASALIASMQDGLAVISPDGILVAVNERFCEMTGFGRENLVGSSMPFPHWPPEERERIRAALDHILATGTGAFDLVFARRDGRRFPVILTAAPVMAPDGSVSGYVETVKDVADRRRAELEVREGAEEQAALRRIALQVARDGDADEAYLAGLLCRTGCAALVASGLSEQRVRPPDAGAYLLGVWGLPERVVTAVGTGRRARPDDRDGVVRALGVALACERRVSTVPA